jgi:hypothetical protein
MQKNNLFSVIYITCDYSNDFKKNRIFQKNCYFFLNFFRVTHTIKISSFFKIKKENINTTGQLKKLKRRYIYEKIHNTHLIIYNDKL